MKILLINWMDMANPMSGGAEVHLTEIFRRFVERGDEITLVSSGFEGGAKHDEYCGIKIIRTGTRETFNFAAPRLLRRLEHREHFDLVVEDINKVPLFTPLYLKKPLLVIIPHLFGKTVFRETNAVVASYVYLMERFVPWLYRRAIFEVISESTADDLVSRGVDPGLIRVVHCGMDHELYNVDPSVEKFKQPTILYLGRVKRYKCIDVLLRSLPEVIRIIPQARLVIVGSGDYLDELKKCAGKLRIFESVVFTGFVSSEEKLDWMRRSHVIVNPSPKEGWGLTNIEANACGTPSIATDADGLRDSVRDGETGFLFPFGDHQTLAQKAVQILQNNELRRKLSQNAIAWAGTFTWGKAALKTMEIIEAITVHHSPSI